MAVRMNHRDRILAAIRHQRLDRPATDIWATQEVWDKLQDHFDADGRLAVYDKLGIDGIMGIAPPYIGPELPADPDWPADFTKDAWGMGYQAQAYGTGSYNEQVLFPLASAETIADLEAYPWPSPDWYDYGAIPALAAEYPGRAIQCGYTAVFYYHNKLRGLELSLMDPILRPEFTHHLVGRISEFFAEYHRRCFEAGRGVIDMTQVTDDFGSQTGLMISPRIFEQFYRASIQRAIDLAKRYGLYVFHHDDGDCRKLLPRLTEMGIDILNPIQWRCGNWDLQGLKAEFGNRLCFHGGVDNQVTLPFGSADDVRAEVRRLLADLAPDRTGLIVAPCHNLQAVSPVENIIALYEAASAF
jgi:uroporphyrinogen decarboxylase